LVLYGAFLVGVEMRVRAVSAHPAPGPAAQIPTPGQVPAPGSNQPEMQIPGEAAHDPAHERMRQQVIVSANEARHKRMSEDANKLFDLSKQLKDDVDKAANDELSLDVMRKAAEIEKLAHGVRERMRQ
jgi:hypothetical protein